MLAAVATDLLAEEAYQRLPGIHEFGGKVSSSVNTRHPPAETLAARSFAIGATSTSSRITTERSRAMLCWISGACSGCDDA